jgi:glucose-1-phosphate adenylyltransferase, GlgD subunit
MNDVMGMIYTGEGDSRLRELTLTRAIAALPVLSRYRVIDFLVSSFVNSGVHNVGVVMQRNYHSLMDHLGSGKEWDLHSKNNGLFILPPFLTRENVGIYSGVLDALRSNTSYLARSKQEYVILSDSTILFNMNFEPMLKAHIDSGAEITCLYTKDPSMLRSEYGSYLNIDDKGYITDMEVEPTKPGYKNVYMRVMLLKRELLRKLVDDAVAHGFHDMDRDVIQRLIKKDGIRVFTHEYKGHCWHIDSVQSYFQLSMAMLDEKVRREVFSPDLPVYTKVRDEMPASYGEGAQCINSLVADGCVIEGKVENSILFRGVRIAPDTYVKNCIIMQDGHVHSGAHIENCILDKQAVIKRNAKLIGPDSYPIVIAKNVVI